MTQVLIGGQVTTIAVDAGASLEERRGPQGMRRQRNAEQMRRFRVGSVVEPCAYEALCAASRVRLGTD